MSMSSSVSRKKTRRSTTPRYDLVKATPRTGMNRNFPADHMRELNRSAIVVTPKRPFLEWIHSVDPTSSHLTLHDFAQEPTNYLVSECESEEDFDDCLRELFPI